MKYLILLALILFGISFLFSFFARPLEFVSEQWRSVHDYEDYYMAFENRRLWFQIGFGSLDIALFLLLFIIEIAKVRPGKKIKREIMTKL